ARRRPASAVRQLGGGRRDAGTRRPRRPICTPTRTDPCAV
ncbi:MAG: hypothetical protein AVDCRST_MAG19-1268, partial [uncultured Thermomicrobiales bacterium]